MDFRGIPKGIIIIYIGNNTSANVLGIGNYKLVMWRGCTLYLHDVLYASEVQRNLVTVVVLLQLGFKIVFGKECKCIVGQCLSRVWLYARLIYCIRCYFS